MKPKATQSITFQADMALAVREDRKTETRRPNVKKYSALRPGDLLWVKEAGCRYRRYGQQPGEFQIDYEGTEKNWPKLNPRYFPRWASRTTLRVVSVRVERLQGITPEAVEREGMAVLKDGIKQGNRYAVSNAESRIKRFAAYWDHLYRKEPEKQWATNPEVCVIEFEVVK